MRMVYCIKSCAEIEINERSGTATGRVVVMWSRVQSKAVSVE